jgi:lipopolysaccharide biosynthesis glycosyltransferase
LGSLIKDEIEKVLYLDADTLVLGSLKELYDLNMEDYVVAGVQDFYYSSLKDFGLKNKNIYLNTGVLLINFSEWIKLERKFHEYIEKLDDLDSIMHDQGIINAIVEDDKKLLTKPHYNVLESYINDVGKIKKLLDFYEALYRILYSDNLDDAYRNPIIVHDKFWAKNYNNKRFREKYEEYVLLSPFEHDEIFTNIKNKNRESTFKSQIFFITPEFLYPALRKLFRIIK